MEQLKQQNLGEYLPTISWDAGEGCNKAQPCNLCYNGRPKSDYRGSNANPPELSQFKNAIKGGRIGFDKSKYNIVVSHGGFIKANMCKNQKRFKNCEAATQNIELSESDIKFGPCKLDIPNRDIQNRINMMGGMSLWRKAFGKYGTCEFPRKKLYNCRA